MFRFNPRSHCNSSSRCCYRAREHVDSAGYRGITHGGDSHPEMSSSPGSMGLARAHPLTKTQDMESFRQTWSSYGPPYPVGRWSSDSPPPSPLTLTVSSTVFPGSLCSGFLLPVVRLLGALFCCCVVIPGEHLVPLLFLLLVLNSRSLLPCVSIEIETDAALLSIPRSSLPATAVCLLSSRRLPNRRSAPRSPSGRTAFCACVPTENNRILGTTLPILHPPWP